MERQKDVLFSRSYVEKHWKNTSCSSKQMWRTFPYGEQDPGNSSFPSNRSLNTFCACESHEMFEAGAPWDLGAGWELYRAGNGFDGDASARLELTQRVLIKCVF